MLTSSKTPMTAVPNDSPRFVDVFKIPDASACCSSGADDRMRLTSGPRARPSPAPMRIVPGKISTICVFKLNTPRRSSDPKRAMRMPRGIRKRGARRAESGPDANEVMSRAIISGINATPVIKELTPVTACKNIGMMKTIPARLRRKTKFATFPALYARARKSVMSVSGTLWWLIRRRCQS